MIDFDDIDRWITRTWQSLTGMNGFVASTVILLLAVAAGLGLGGLLQRLIARRLTDLSSSDERRIALLPIRQPLRILLPVLFVLFVLPLLRFHPKVLAVLEHLGALMFIGLLAWLLVSGLTVVREVVVLRYAHQGEADSLSARRFLTQFKTLQNVVNVIVVLLAVSAGLMTFEAVRRVGLSLLASAGVAGIIVGFAAQRTIATFLAGIQIAVAQPIRLLDAVTVEGEYGTIEDITLTYVVVRLWDRRCLILPITYFIDKPFLNFSRGGTRTIGAVYLYVDYATPVPPLREELYRILSAAPLWDGITGELLVTKVTERTLELRATMSAADPDAAFDLRCLVREQLVAYLAEHYPYALPHDRLDSKAPTPDSPALRHTRKD